MKIFMRLANSRVIVLILLLIICIFFFLNSKQVKQIQFLNDEIYSSQKLVNSFYIEKTAFEKFLMRASMEKFDMALNINNLNGEVDTLMNLIKKPELIFLFSDLDCNSCIEKEFKQLKENLSEFTSRITVLASYSRVRDFVLYLRENAIYYDCFMFDRLTMNSSLLKLNSPVLFILFPDGRIMLPFAPDKGDMERSLEYYRLVKQVLNENEN